MKRILELDYLKGILILLVISFHLVYFEHLYPYAKQVVYAFHMPGFLLISGYLMNINKPLRDFLRTLIWLAVPYIIMESGYIVMASLLPINEHIDHLTIGVFFDRLLLHPLGPYWYLHTLIICGGIYYLVINSKFKIQKRTPLEGGWGGISRLFLIGLAYYAVSYILGTILPLKGIGGTFAFSSALYFLAGAAIRQSGKDFLSIFWASPFALLLFALLIIPHFSLYTFNFSFLIVYFAISSLLWIYKNLPPQGKVWRRVLFLGRNSLPLYVFSPIFTILCKQFVPYLQFDPTGLIFLLVSLVFCVAGSLTIAWLMDVTGISPYFFGKKALN